MSENTIKQLPSSPEAEQALLGCIIQGGARLFTPQITNTYGNQCLIYIKKEWK